MLFKLSQATTHLPKKLLLRINVFSLGEVYNGCSLRHLVARHHCPEVSEVDVCDDLQQLPSGGQLAYSSQYLEDIL